MTPADLLDRLQTVLHPQITADADARRGLLELATDREEALIKAIRSVSKKWMCLLWIAGLDGTGPLADKGKATVELRCAVAMRPRLTRDPSAEALSATDDHSLLNVWETVRGLMVRVRFGTLTPDDPEAGKATFRTRAGYLDGTRAMKMGKTTITREFFEIKGAGTAEVRELLWAETAWMVSAGLPMLDESNTDIEKHFLCA